MMKINKSKLLKSFGKGTIVTAIVVLWRKIGGYASGGNYSEPHTWEELNEFIPEFFFFFVVTSLGLYIFEQFKTEPINHICTVCDEAFSYTGKNKEGRCPKCGGKSEPAIGFYARHPELKNN